MREDRGGVRGLGVFQVVDHGVDPGLIADMTRLAREFFALPPEEKLRFDMTGGKKGGFIVSSHLQVRNVSFFFFFFADSVFCFCSLLNFFS